MTKAWPGLLAAGIPLLYRTLARGRGRQEHPPRIGLWIAAGLVALTIALPWHLWQYRLYGGEFLREYVGLNLMGRVFQVVEEHRESPLFYVDVVRQGFSIWGYLGAPAFLWALWKGIGRGERRAWLLLSWITLPLALFSLAQTRLGWYIGMVYPAVALLIAGALAELLTARVALGLIAPVMLLCCIRLPVPADGSPDVKAFAPRVMHLVPPGETISVVQPACPPQDPAPTAGAMLLAKTHPRTALLFYLDRPLACIPEAEALTAATLPQGYVVSDREGWQRFSHRGTIVIDGEKYLLAQWH
jgi:4-amino-4-deoxy-L-arabinose transferase-like glycosyltransferase